MGDLDEARSAFHQAHELGHDPQPGLALLFLAEGKPDAALSSIKRSLDSGSYDKLGRCRLLSPMVSIALAVGELETARAAAAEAEEISSAFGSPVLEACSHCARGEIQLVDGQVDAALKSFREAWQLWRKADLPYEAARARMLMGVALRESGDDEGAALELQAAKSVFQKLGAVLDLRRAMDLLGEEIAEGLPKAAAPSTRVTKTFMFTDIVNSTNLVGVMGDEAWERVLAWHDKTMRQLFMTNCGEEVKQVGDGFFVAFEEASEAIECAVAIQRKLAEHRKESGFAPEVRIGLHTTEATAKAGDYAGKGVHESARIGALATGGEIVASRQVIDAHRPRFPVSPFRKVELKGVAEAAEVASIDPQI
jgi:class 3 adenylate cyclase